MRPVGFGLDATDHAVPSHLSINVTRDVSPLQPTATQLAALTHDTPFRSAFGAGLGFGDGVTDQVDPCNVSTSVRWFPPLVRE